MSSWFSLMYAAPCVGTALVLLIMACSATPGPAPVSAQTASRDTTIVQHGPGDLEFSLRLSPIPRRIGDTMHVTVTVRNLGSAPAKVGIGPCYLTYKGIQPHPLVGRPVCAAASGEVSLASGESWTMGDGWELTGPPGRYPFRMRVALEPPVWLGTDLYLEARPDRAQSASSP